MSEEIISLMKTTKKISELEHLENRLLEYGLVNNDILKIIRYSSSYKKLFENYNIYMSKTKLKKYFTKYVIPEYFDQLKVNFWYNIDKKITKSNLNIVLSQLTTKLAKYKEQDRLFQMYLDDRDRIFKNILYKDEMDDIRQYFKENVGPEIPSGAWSIINKTRVYIYHWKCKFHTIVIPDLLFWSNYRLHVKEWFAKNNAKIIIHSYALICLAYDKKFTRNYFKVRVTPELLFWSNYRLYVKQQMTKVLEHVKLVGSFDRNTHIVPYRSIVKHYENKVLPEILDTYVEWKCIAAYKNNYKDYMQVIVLNEMMNILNMKKMMKSQVLPELLLEYHNMEKKRNVLNIIEDFIELDHYDTVRVACIEGNIRTVKKYINEMDDGQLKNCLNISSKKNNSDIFEIILNIVLDKCGHDADMIYNYFKKSIKNNDIISVRRMKSKYEHALRLVAQDQNADFEEFVQLKNRAIIHSIADLYDQKYIANYAVSLLDNDLDDLMYDIVYDIVQISRRM